MVDCGSCASAKERCGNGLEKIYPSTAVRYGRMRHIGEFSHHPEMKFSCGGKVVISTDRGIEIGQQVSLTCHGCDKSVTREAMREYARSSAGDSFRLKNGRILREATPSDLSEWRHIDDQTFDKLTVCRRFARELGLHMKIVDAEHLFGGEWIVFYFMAEERIDFRELVRRLAPEFQTRIEMRQIGARDEARLLADHETCGRECCCKNFLKTLKPVGMSMAKLQKTTLDLAKVSGRCGRLKCCLRFEHESYQGLNKTVPRLGMRIRSPEGTGRIVDRQVLTQLVKIRTDEGKFLAVAVEDILERNVPEPEPVSPRPGRGGRPAPGPGRDGNRGRRDRPVKGNEPPAGSRPPGAETRGGAPASPPPPATDAPAAGDQAPEQGDRPESSEAPKPPRRRRRRGRNRRNRGDGEGGGSDGGAPSGPSVNP